MYYFTRKSYIARFLLSMLFITSAIVFSTNPLKADDDIKIKGRIDSLQSDTTGTNSLYVNGYQVFVDSSTDYEGDHIFISGFSDLAIGDSVKVEANYLPDSTLLADTIEVYGDMGHNGDDDSDLEVKGYIDSVGTDFINVGGYSFTVTDSTLITGEHHMVLTFSDLASGQYVEVKALMQADSSWWARKIKVENEDDHHDLVEYEGVIDSLGADWLVVSGTTFGVDSNTVVEGDDHTPLMYSDLATGMYVEVKAATQPDGSLLANKIKTEDNHDQTFEISGAIDAISGDTLTVSGMAFLTDSNTVVLDHQRMPITLADLSAGMIVEVKAQILADGSFYAKRVKVDDFWNPTTEVTGAIDSLGADWLAVLGTVYSVDSATVYFDANGLPSDFSALTVGLRVEVKALEQADGTFLALRVKVKNNNPGDMQMYGAIDTLDAATITVGGVLFDVDAATLVFDQFNNPAAYTDLTAGMLVEIHGTVQASGTPLATSIKIEDSPSFTQVSGTLTTINGNTVTVAQNVYALDANTVLIDAAFQPITVNQINSGSTVKVWANNAAPTAPNAMQIQVTADGITDVGNPGELLPSTYSLGQNYPNPFNPTTSIPFAISGNGFEKVSLTIYNVLGQNVKTLFSGVLSAGTYSMTWDGTNNNGSVLPSGVYFYQLKAGNSFVQVQRMLFVK